MRTAPMPQYPVSAENVATTKLPRVRSRRRWHRAAGIREEPESWEMHMAGVQKCLCLEYRGHIELVRLLVAKRWRGRGVGQRAVRHLQGHGKPIEVYPVSDDYRQADLERFYRKLGFHPRADDPDCWRWEPIAKFIANRI